MTHAMYTEFEKAKSATVNFQFANPTELNFGVTEYELCAAEGLATFISEAGPIKQPIKKTRQEIAEIIGINYDGEENQDAVNYAITVCKRIFPHYLQIQD